ncbi:hypothetical protein M1145_02575 [Patescibacteria group bacterium]|nr:hypothetical protein [Patescibacteria group bacterium]
MDQNIKTTIRIPKVLVVEYKSLARETKMSFNNSIRIAMEYFLSKDSAEQKSLMVKRKKTIILPSKNLGKISSLKRKDIYEGAF